MLLLNLPPHFFLRIPQLVHYNLQNLLIIRQYVFVFLPFVIRVLGHVLSLQIQLHSVPGREIRWLSAQRFVVVHLHYVVNYIEVVVDCIPTRHHVLGSHRRIYVHIPC